MAYHTSQLFVGHLHPDTTSKDFERRFAKYGKMRRCEIKKGYGFIEYEDIRDAEDAVKEENDTTFQGNRIVVEWAKGSSRYQGRPSMNRRRRSPDRDRDHDRDDYNGDRRKRFCCFNFRRASPEYNHRRRSRERRRTPSSSRSRSRTPSRSPLRRRE